MNDFNPFVNVTNEHVRQSNLIEGIDDFEEDLRSIKAWRWLRRQKTITPQVILELHRRITSKQLPKDQCGQFRRVQVYVGNHTPPPWMVVSQLVFDWCMDWMHKAGEEDIDPKTMHIRYETIHPFIDGNGRTGRMLMWWMEIQQYEYPTMIYANERGNYYDWFRKDLK